MTAELSQWESDLRGPRPQNWLKAAECLELLPDAVRRCRVDRKLSLRAAAEQIGVPFTTLAAIEKDRRISVPTAVLLLRWLGYAPGWPPR